MKLPGQVTITRRSTPRGSEFVIAIIDRRSDVQFVEASLTAEEFALAISSLGHRPCTLNLNGLHNIGKLSEVKQEVVPIPEGVRYKDDDAATKILAPHEVDGWRAHRSDLWNGHRRAGKNAQTVTFRRHVDAPDGYVDPEDGV